MELTEEQIENRYKLINYLESGELKAGFSMQDFSNVFTSFQEETECGTVGCAVGHGPYAGIPKLPTENWVTYSERVFGISKATEWSYCFSGAWSRYGRDNTPQGGRSQTKRDNRKRVT